HIFDQHRDLFVVDRALVAGRADRTQEFFAIKRFLSPVSLHDDHAVAYERFRGGESIAALEAFPAPARVVAIARDARIDDLVLNGSALGAAHAVRSVEAEEILQDL